MGRDIYELRHRVRSLALERLERCEGKLSRTVLRGGSDRKVAPLPGNSDHPGGDFTDVYAAILPSLKFEPSLHVHYESTVLRMPDGLPKMKDLPTEFGGSGETMEE